MSCYQKHFNFDFKLVFISKTQVLRELYSFFCGFSNINNKLINRLDYCFEVRTTIQLSCLPSFCKKAQYFLFEPLRSFSFRRKEFHFHQPLLLLLKKKKKVD